MRLKNVSKVLVGVAGLAVASSAWALSLGSVVDLQEWATNSDGVINDVYSVDGSTSGLSSLPGGTFDATGLGSVTFTVTGTGTHYFGMFVDPELNQLVNGFTNEFGTVVGSAAAGQSFQIDDPNVLTPALSNPTSSFAAGALTNTNTEPAGPLGNGLTCCDVSMALGWGFTLAAGQTANITFTLSGAAPGGGFYLQQTDGYDATGAPSGDSVYYSSALSINGGGTQVPEPATLGLLGLGLAATALGRRRRS